MVEEIDLNEWCYIVRKGTNECFVNISNFVNVARKEHAERIMRGLNYYSNNWELMSVADFNTKFRMVGV